jgi:3-oxocholest-4-en-26-oyl-CoA dehydrogenase alpha subunit
MVDFCPDDTEQLKAWRREVHDFLRETLPDKPVFDYDYDEDEKGWAVCRQFWRKVGAKGWIALTWPTEYFGQGRSVIEKWILQEEFSNYGVPSHPAIGFQTADHILRLGTHEQKKRHLKGIAEATTLWGEGFSEPGAGSDLAALTTRAHLDGDHWVINGQKTLGTAAHECQWMLVLARSDPNSVKHEGISCFLVPLDTPGVVMTPLHNMAGGRQNHTFFDNVRVDQDLVLGDIGQAWNQVWFRLGGAPLAGRAATPDPWQFRMMRILNAVLRYCRETKKNGRPLSEDPVVRLQLAEIILGIEVIKLDVYKNHSDVVTARLGYGRYSTPNLDMIFYKEFWPRMAQICMEIVGPMSQIQGGRWAVLEGHVQHFFRASFGNHAGGTSQIKRMTFATRGLGLPR